MSTTKRKSDGAAGGSRTKKSKNVPDHTEAKELIDTVLDGDGGALDASEARTVAEYARWLEGEVVAMKPKEKSSADITRAAEKLRSACVSGIKKQMTVRRPSYFRRVFLLIGLFSGNPRAKAEARSGRTMACAPTLLFSVLCSISARRRSGRCRSTRSRSSRPLWDLSRRPSGMFLTGLCPPLVLITRVVRRYDSLELMANVTVRYQPDEETFKMSGSYGAPRHIKD
jgi:hypothetical protein